MFTKSMRAGTFMVRCTVWDLISVSPWADRITVRHVVFIMTADAPPAVRGTQPQLVFDRYGARGFLHAIHVPEDAGAMLKSSRSELEAARSLSPPAPAMVRVHQAPRPSLDADVLA
jgi:hypothetical protein